jgi:hypothetical protein
MFIIEEIPINFPGVHLSLKVFNLKLIGIQLDVSRYDWSWDNFEPTKDKLQTMVWDESLAFHPLENETESI